MSTRDTAAEMDHHVSGLFSKYGLEGVATKASGSVNQDGDRIIDEYMREDKHRETESWTINRKEFQKALEQSLRQGKSLLFVSRNKHREVIVSMKIEQFLPLLSTAMTEKKEK